MALYGSGIFKIVRMSNTLAYFFAFNFALHKMFLYVSPYQTFLSHNFDFLLKGCIVIVDEEIYIEGHISMLPCPYIVILSL